MNQKIEERRLVTVLFADFSGFTALSSKLDPEEVRDVVNIGFNHLNPAILKHHGTIHKYEGDLVIALFGFPMAHEDDPESAVLAAFEMMNLMPEINQALTKKLKRAVDIGLHAGINSGIVVVGEVGSQEKKEYTVMGDTVNLASRLKDIAKKGEVIVSESVFRASRYLFEYEAYPTVSIKGIEETVRVFRPLRIKEKPEPKRGIQGAQAPLIGREKELTSLRQAVEKLIKGEGGTVFIIGDAGLGKSRLYNELKKYIAEQQLPLTTLEGNCLAQEEAIPYWPFLQVLENIFEITNHDSAEIVKEKILKKTRSLLPDNWQELVPYLSYLFAVRYTDELDQKIKHLYPQDLKLQIHVSVKRLINSLASERALILVIEDYHLIDKASLELLEFILDLPSTSPILFIALSRPAKDRDCFEVKERLSAKRAGNYQEIILDMLDSRASEKLVDSFLQVSGISDRMKKTVIAKAGGNPFYLEEILRSLIDSGMLAFSAGRWSLSSDVTDFNIPDTVQAVIAARLDRLEPDIKEVLQTAAVVGQKFYEQVLQYLCNVDTLMLTLHLATLEEYEFINELKRVPELEYMFRHLLLQEVTYNTLLKKRRQELHEKAGEIIEKIYKNRLDDFAEHLAYHYANSNNIGKALEWLKKAGQKAKDRYANDEAIKFFQKVVQTIKEKRSERKQELCSAHEALGDIYVLKGEYRQAEDHFEEMYLNAGGDKIAKSQARRKIAEIYEKQGKYNDAMKIIEEIGGTLTGNSIDEVLERSEIDLSRCYLFGLRGEIDKAIREGEIGLKTTEENIRSLSAKIDEKKIMQLKTRWLNHLGGIFFKKGEYAKMIEVNKRCLKLCEAIGDKRMIYTTIGNLGLTYYLTGDHEKAIEFLQKALTTAEEIGSKHDIGVFFGNLGAVYTKKGHYAKALEFLHKHLEISEEIGAKLGTSSASVNIGNVYEALGDYEKALMSYHRCLEISTEIGNENGVAQVYCELGRLSLKTDKLKNAQEYLLKAEEICRKIDNKIILSEVYIVFAELKNIEAIILGHPCKDALEYVNRVYEFAKESASKPDIASCHATYGKIYTTEGDYKRAEENFRDAIKIYEELKESRALAETYLAYAQMLKKGAEKGLFAPALATEYFNKARTIYQDLKLPHKIKECN